MLGYLRGSECCLFFSELQESTLNVRDKRYRLSKSINGLGLDLTSITTTTVKRLLTNQMCAMHSTNQFTEKNTSDQKNPDKKT